MRPGTRLNNVYEIERLVAQGGMGEVYRGFNIQTGDPVAIKMIRPEFASDPEILDLFRREASILHSFTNDAIVRYFVFSVDPQLERAYLAMEFVEGPSLKKRLGSGPLPLAEARILQKRVASALEAAHQHGVVHRDISPDNLIMPDGDVRSAKVIDFGIARSRRKGEETILGGGFAGKLNYASPEQLGLAGGDVTAKSDIYSFGLVLAEALLGKPIDMAGTQAEMVDKRRVVPAELSWVDPTLRPLLQAMLQPLPENRPSSMAEVAAWEPPDLTAARALKAPPVASERSGRTPALIGALIAVLSLGGAAYVFRDDLARWAGTFSAPSAGQGEVATTSPTTKLPPLASQQLPPLARPSGPQEGTTPASPPAPESNAPGQTETARIEPPPASEPAGPAPRPVTAETLADALPPKAAQASVDLPSAMVGSAYRADLPAFGDPSGKGLRLTASGLPDGLTFSDAGGGKGAIEGVPQQATSASIRIVATNHQDRTAQMSAALVVGDKPTPPPPGPVAKVETPIPAPPQKSSPVPVSPQPAVPPPAVQVSTPPPTPPAVQVSTPPPTPPTVQAAAPASVSQNAAPVGQSPAPAQQTVARVEPPPPAPPVSAPSEPLPPSVAPASVEEKAKAFIARFDGGECFLVEPLPGSTRPHEYQAVGQAIEPFRRFDSAYKREVGVEADLTVAPITAEQCPALDLVRLAPPAGRRAPRLTLKSYEVGPGQPLVGTVSNLEGRRLYLILVDNDGLAHRLEAKVDANGDSAAVSVPLTADASSVGPMQMLLAIVSDQPIPALDALHSANLKLIASRLVDDARRASASVEADYFKFVN